ncbi:hypothetical protein NS263_04210 [Curtobacterium oceanosedimentum]|uniref:Alpha/beta hydrolase n=1 Tax=Curtobacterium oceanosedimentum TaxID=465820 RepID=A0ABR5S8I9_9MICO|nr:hypothetical protein [Curtobacterium oceanosedimentum]KTR41566.1 hypothetical protein NS263_04210 [Curtobacterium oceanosedimentum]
MTWTDDDPGQGEPPAILGLAKLRTARAQEIRRAQDTLTTASGDAGVGWQAQSQTAFAAEVQKTAGDVELLAVGMEKQAAVLTQYAGQLSQLKDRQRILEQRRASAKSSLARANAMMPGGLFSEPTPAPFVLAGEEDSTAEAKAEEEARQRAAAESKIAAAQADLRAIESEWDALVADRRRVDQSCSTALEAADILGAVSSFSGSAVSAASPGDLLDRLSVLSAIDLQVLLAAHPELAEKLQAASTQDVATWWNALDAEHQQTFIVGLPNIIGSLNGVSALGRVAANRINAANRLEAIERTLADWKRQAAQPGSFTNATSQISALEDEIKYLRGAVSEPPTVQLYLYDKDADRIIEMIGTPSPETKRVVTYTPGTLANLDGFYSGDTQSIADWLHKRDEDGMVAFVVKDGRYPQNPLTEANDQQYARGIAQNLADFEEVAFTDPLLEGRQSVAIGHSWGVANITVSEALGAHYDKVVSLSGAGAPADWTPSPTTEYRDFSYDDILQFAQDIRVGEHGAVWSGRNPREVGFAHEDYYDAPLTWKSFPGNGLVNPLLAAAGGIESHNLAASTAPGNLTLLNDMRDFINEAGAPR